MAAVERILEASADSQESSSDEWAATAEHALWICACVTPEDAPTWLICDTAAGRLRWRRVPGRVEPLDLVDARRTAGGHADPAQVLGWLNGEVQNPWGAGGHGTGDPGVLQALRQQIASP